MTPADWNNLAARCEAAKGPDDWELLSTTTNAIMRGVGYELRSGMYWRAKDGNWFADGNRIMVSLDAITALVERELAVEWLRQDKWAGKPATCSILMRPTPSEPIGGKGATPALALCAAFCRAMAAREGNAP